MQFNVVTVNYNQTVFKENKLLNKKLLTTLKVFKAMFCFINVKLWDEIVCFLFILAQKNNVDLN